MVNLSRLRMNERIYLLSSCNGNTLAIIMQSCMLRHRRLVCECSYLIETEQVFTADIHVDRQMRRLSCFDVSLLCISLAIPPAGVFGKKGCSHETGISVMLSLLFYFPGVIYAFTIILSHPKKKSAYEDAADIEQTDQLHIASINSEQCSTADELC
ncbi:UPF0057 membrane protein T23F2.4 [Toxocara canis]|uniref:UPF0057 membrane protein T23F2.4 n=1 Tax=Toxocara canis TaxID=6265 RepID=A0A0B2V183_TOXCA|nr:UPF0057 membrane protein T23F2.4 [Toxocara canis]